MNPQPMLAFSELMRFGLLIPFVLCAIARAQDLREAVPVPPFRAGLPDSAPDVEWVLAHREDGNGVVQASAYIACRGRLLSLTWEWFPEWPSTKGRRSLGASIAFEGILTDLAVLEDGVFVLAGEDGEANKGCTRLERIELRYPVVDLEARRLRAGEPIARRTLWVGETPYRQVIAQLGRWPGNGPIRLVALMWDTPEIHAFDVEAGEWSRLAAVRSFGEPDVFDERELVRTYRRLSIRNHRRHGYMLTLSTRYGCVASEKDRTLMLADVDRDGVLDRSMLLDSEGWWREDLFASKDLLPSR